jgi:hypothetical protein
MVRRNILCSSFLAVIGLSFHERQSELTPELLWRDEKATCRNHEVLLATMRQDAIGTNGDIDSVIDRIKNGSIALIP